MRCIFLPRTARAAKTREKKTPPACGASRRENFRKNFLDSVREFCYICNIKLQKSHDGKKYAGLRRAESRCVVKTGGQELRKFFPELLR